MNNNNPIKAVRKPGKFEYNDYNARNIDIMSSFSAPIFDTKDDKVIEDIHDNNNECVCFGNLSPDADEQFKNCGLDNYYSNPNILIKSLRYGVQQNTHKKFRKLRSEHLSYCLPNFVKSLLLGYDPECWWRWISILQ